MARCEESHWRILDDNGTVFSGTEEEMRDIWSKIIEGSYREDENTSFEPSGDILLVEVRGIIA